MAIMRSFIVGAFTAASLAGPALAQQKAEKEPMQLEEERKKKDAEVVDRQYKSTLDRTRRETTQNRADPWQNMRGDDAKTKR